MAVDLEFSDEEAELRDNVRSVLTGICPPSVVRGIYENKGEPAGVWEQMVELHWPALAIPVERKRMFNPVRTAKPFARSPTAVRKPPSSMVGG